MYSKTTSLYKLTQLQRNTCKCTVHIKWTTKWKHRHWLQITTLQSTQLVIFIHWLVVITYLVSVCRQHTWQSGPQSLLKHRRSVVSRWLHMHPPWSVYSGTYFTLCVKAYLLITCSGRLKILHYYSIIVIVININLYSIFVSSTTAVHSCSFSLWK